MNSNPRTATFLFTDLENSTPLWEKHPAIMPELAARHDALIREAIEAHRGRVVKTTGDGFMAVFDTATDGVLAALAAQRALIEEPWPSITGPLRVRMGLHTGESRLRNGDYYGSEVNRAARVMSLANGAQILISEATAALIRNNLPPLVSLFDLGEHRLKGLVTAEQIFQIYYPGLPSEFPPLKSPAVYKHNLPMQMSSFVGRRKEVAELQRLLSDEAGGRLVTIVGPGGIGKTRLSLETAAAEAAGFRDGVFFVGLAPVTDTQQIVTTISDSIGFRYSAGSDPRQGLLDYLQHKQLLLVMDNFEHMLTGADLVTTILQHAALVKILCTSRERLNLSSEKVFMLSGLDYPSDLQLPSEEAAQFGAVQLLLDRARLVRPGLEVDGPALAQVARICRLVQGMPLALVLAAGWLELLTFEEVADEIAASLDILESQARDMPQRQRSVRAAFDYSWQRLATADKQAFSHLAVFRSGFSRRAAQQVSGAGLRTLRTLLEKSLITAEGPDRYVVHELLRQFAEEKLEAASQAEPIRDAHSHYYLQAVAQREGDLKGRRQLEALEEIEVDLDNLRAAWVWALERQDERGIDLVLESMSLFFYMRSRYQEGWTLFQQALKRPELAQPLVGDSQRVWGRLTARSGLLQSQFTKSVPEIESAIKRSLVIAEANDDQAEIAYSYLALGHYHTRVTNDFRQGLIYFEQSLERYQALADLYYVAHVLHRVGYSHGQVTGQEEDLRYTLQSLELARQIGDLSDAANAVGNLGSLSFVNGDYAGAERYFQEAIELSGQMGHRHTLAHSIIQLGLSQILNGHLDKIQEMVAEGLVIAKDIENPSTQAYGLAVLSMRASLASDYEAGKRLADESLALFTNMFGNFLGHWAQATAYVGLGQTEQAWQQARAALELGYRWRWYGMMTWMLPVVGIILAQQGQPQRASEILGLYFNHAMRPIGWAEKWPLLSEWQARLQESLGADGYREAYERGRSLDLMTAVEAFLALADEAP